MNTTTKPLNQNKMRSYKKELEDEIFDIVTDLIRKDLSKGEAVSKLLILFNVSGSVCDECTDGSGWHGDEDITYNCSKCNPEAN